MSKDPAFLFYTKDFYEGTRTMLPEERACFIDLLIYQHQHGPIPLDLKRIQMYCSGISEATLIATLEAKFKQDPSGWVNKKLELVQESRENFSKKQVINGTVGQFWKKSKQKLSKKDYTKLRSLASDICSSNRSLYDNWISKIKDPLDMLEAMLKHLEDVNGNVIEELNIDWNLLLEKFNALTGKKSKSISETVKRKIRARLAEGYSKKEFWQAIENCYKDPYHQENPKYLTLEFISRPDKFEKYHNTSQSKSSADDLYNKTIPLGE